MKGIITCTAVFTIVIITSSFNLHSKPGFNKLIIVTTVVDGTHKEWNSLEGVVNVYDYFNNRQALNKKKEAIEKAFKKKYPDKVLYFDHYDNMDRPENRYAMVLKKTCYYASWKKIQISGALKANQTEADKACKERLICNSDASRIEVLHSQMHN